MPSLHEYLERTREIRPRPFGLMIAPFVGERAGTFPPRHVEEAAVTVLAAVFQQSGPIREQLLFERRRFERLANLVYRCPERRGGG